MSDTTTLDIIELLLTAEIYNKYPEMDVNDLPKSIRKNYWSRTHKGVPKPINVTRKDIEGLFAIKELKGQVLSLPFIGIDELTSRIKFTSFDVGAERLPIIKRH